MLFFIGFTITAFVIPDKYDASSILKYSDEDYDGSFQPSSGGLAGLASFGGIDLNSSSVDPIDYSIAVIESRDFLKRIIEIEKVKENLAAARSYDPNTRQSIYRSSVFDASNQTWIKDVHFMRIHSRHYLKNLTLTKDRATGFLTVTFRHPNPIFAKDFVQLIIDELNSSIRAIELENSEKKLEFLIQRTSDTNIEVRQALARIIEEELRKTALSSTRVDYLLQVIDPPYVPIRAEYPSRLLIIALGLFIGMALSSIYLQSHVSRRELLRAKD